MIRFLRVLAILIAIIAFLDPAITRSAPQKPDVSLVVAGPLPDPALVERVARSLESVATVIRGPSIGAAGVVSIGYRLPDAAMRRSAAAFALVPVARTPFVSIESVHAPARANLHARVPVAATVRARAARGRTLAVQLEANGVAIDRTTHPVTKDDESVTVELGLVSSTAGMTTPTLTARVEDVSAMAQADVAIRIASDRHSVLLFDRRPSWMSTFVRRALESDARFIVSSRISSSRGAELVSGHPPVSLSGLDAFDLVIIGAPDLMTAADADGLERFMRERGGVVILLMDVATDNAAVNRLTGITRWTRANRPQPGGAPLASEFQTPAELPRWTEPVAIAQPVAKDGVAPIWQTAIGRGRLIVNGALDAWRYRDKAFDEFWKRLASEVTEGVPEVAAFDSAQAAPSDSRGAERRDGGTEPSLLQAWTSSHRGAVFTEADLAGLAPAVARAVAAPVETKSIHPMRSAWWIVPFAGLLGTEWFHRRKNGRR